MFAISLVIVLFMEIPWGEMKWNYFVVLLFPVPKLAQFCASKATDFLEAVDWLA